MTSRHLPTLLLLPGGLLAGHALTYSVLRVGEHGSGAAMNTPMEALLCVSVPLALASLVHAVLDGLRDEDTPIRFWPLALAQVALFVLVEIAEHASNGARPVALAAVTLGVVAQVVAAALLCALVRGATAVGRRARGTLVQPPAPRPRPAGWPPAVLLCLPRLLPPLRRRGPPARVA